MTGNRLCLVAAQHAKMAMAPILHYSNVILKYSKFSKFLESDFCVTIFPCQGLSGSLRFFVSGSRCVPVTPCPFLFVSTPFGKRCS